MDTASSTTQSAVHQEWKQVALAFALKATLTILNFQTYVRKEAAEWPADHLLVFLEAEPRWQPASGNEPTSALVTDRFGLDPWRKTYCCWKSKPIHERPKKKKGMNEQFREIKTLYKFLFFFINTLLLALFLK